MRSRAVKEILCVLTLVLFVIVVTDGSAVSSRTAEEMSESVVDAMDDMSGLEKRENADFKKQFGFNANDFSGVVYYSSDSVMNVREILIVKFSDSEQAESLVEKIETRMREKAALFEGYAPEQSALLGDYALRQSEGFLLFAVCGNPNEVVSAFKKSL